MRRVTDPTAMTAESHSELGLRDTVRLLNQHDAIPAGSLGTVIGWFLGHHRSYVVNFADEGPRVAEVHADEIALAELS